MACRPVFSAASRSGLENHSCGTATPTIVPQQCGIHHSGRARKGKMRLSGRSVRCVRGGREVFSSLDFEASSGAALAVTGANGSGKASLLRRIAGLLTIVHGSIVPLGDATERR